VGFRMRKSTVRLRLGVKRVLRMRKSAYLTYCLFCAVHFALAKKSLLRVSYVYTIIVSVLTGTRKGVLMSEATPLGKVRISHQSQNDASVTS